MEALGLFKVDLLALGALHHLHRCFDLLRRHRNVELSMATVEANDQATYDMLCRGDSVGVFQLESRAQMAMLPRHRPRNYYDLVVQISVVRPGPITGGMVQPYLRRREGKEPVDYPHDSLRPVLQKTLGIPLFQEQVMKLAIVAADYTPGEADQLRRDMAAWRNPGQLQRHHERLITRMQAKGIPLDFAERIFKQIEGFGEYGFPEAHAASFALISYVGAWLKCHYPAEFTCALLNSLPMGFYSPSTLIEDARRHGVEVRPIAIQQSQWDCTLEANEGGFAIRMGLRFVKGLSGSDWQRIEAAASASAFMSLEDVVRRAALDEGALTALAEAGAFDCLGLMRRQALWEVRGLARSKSKPLPVDLESVPVFRPLSLFETITWDHQRAAHSAHGHPLAALRGLLEARGLPDARAIAMLEDGRWVRYAGLIICRQRPGTASGVTFMTMEDESGFVNLVVWPTVWERHVRLAKTEAFLGVDGKLQIQQGVTHVIVESFWKPDLELKPLHGGSRDFH
ncbi:Error-prone DNA polymerase [compost metagenome]